MSGDCFVREVTGRNDVRKRGAALAANPNALREVDLDKVAVLSAKLAKGVQCLHNSGTMCPPRTHAARQRHNCNSAAGECIQTGGAMTTINVVGLSILNET